MKTPNIHLSSTTLRPTKLIPLSHKQVWDEAQEDKKTSFGEERAPYWLILQIIRTAPMHLFTDKERLRNECLSQNYTTATAVQVLQSVMKESRNREIRRCQQLRTNLLDIINASSSILSRTPAGRLCIEECLALIQYVKENRDWHLVKMEQAYARMQGIVEGIQMSQEVSVDTTVLTHWTK